MNKKSKLIHLFLSGMFVMNFVGCSKNDYPLVDENQVDSKIISQRLNFSSIDGFSNKIIELGSMDIDALGRWAAENNPNSMLLNSTSVNFDKSDFFTNLPDSYKAIFNKDGEILLNDKIIWIDEIGNMFEFSKSDDIETLKGGDIAPIGSIVLSTADLEKSATGLTERVTMNANALNAKYQYAFQNVSYKDCGSNTPRTLTAQFKYVHELQSVEVRFPQCVAIAELYLRLKLEYRFSSNRAWQAAGEKRNINVNLTLSNVTLNNGNNVPLSGSDVVNRSFTCSGDQRILLKYTPNSYDTCFSLAAQWSVATSGTLSQALNGGGAYWSHSAAW